MLVPGARAAVWYAADNVYHERMICWPIGELDYIVLTPDMDRYHEHFGPPDITRWHALPHRAARPLYRFSEQLDQQTYELSLERGKQEAAAECQALGVPLPQFEHGVSPSGVVRALPAAVRGAAAGAAFPPGLGAGDAQSRWICVEEHHGKSRGDEITLNGQELLQ
eukprot:713692-Amphidinium_carterae.2